MLAVAALCAASVAAQAASAADGTIEGTVKDFGTSSPIAGIKVCAENQTTFDETCTQSGVDGKYTVGGLTEGSYIVGFLPADGVNYLRQWYSEKTRPEFADLVELAQGEHETGKDARLHPGGQVTGVVTDSVSAKGVAGVEVCVYNTTNEIPECAFSDTNGAYTISALRTGMYKVEFNGTDFGYVRQYYNGVTDYNASTPVSVTEGAKKTAVNAPLTKGASISGLVTDAVTHEALGEILICLYDPVTEEAVRECIFAKSNGTYSFLGLDSGSYKIGFSEGPSTDGYETQYFDRKATFEEATAITLSAPQAQTADAPLQPTGSSPPPPGGGGAGTLPISAPVGPRVVPPTTAPPTKLTCKKGYKKKTVKGKARCVKKKKKKRKH